MAASSTDKLIKGARKWSSTLTASIADAAVTTMAVVTEGLPTDTAVEVTIDRVDSSGTKTPAKEEVVRGTVSGGASIIGLVRGVEGTAQAHSTGAVVEVRLTADQYNRMVDWGLAEHNQQGTHDAVTATTVATTGAVSTDTVSEKTAEAGVTVDGLKIKDSKLETANSVVATNITQNAVTGPKLATDAITLGYAEITSDFTSTTVGSDVDVTDLATTVTVPAGGRRLEVIVNLAGFADGNGILTVRIKEGSTVLTNIAGAIIHRGSFAYSTVASAGSHTYKVAISQSSAGTMTVRGGATYPTYILAKLI